MNAVSDHERGDGGDAEGGFKMSTEKKETLPALDVATGSALPSPADCFPPSAKPFYWGHRQWLADMDRHALEMLVMNLLLKREADGINGRTWDAHQHLFFESLVAHALPRLPNIRDDARPGGSA